MANSTIEPGLPESTDRNPWEAMSDVCKLREEYIKESHQVLMISDCIDKKPKPNKAYYFIHIGEDMLSYEKANIKQRNLYRIDCQLSKKEINVNGQNSNDSFMVELLDLLNKASEQLMSHKAKLWIKEEAS